MHQRSSARKLNAAIRELVSCHDDDDDDEVSFWSSPSSFGLLSLMESCRTGHSTRPVTMVDNCWSISIVLRGVVSFRLASVAKCKVTQARHKGGRVSADGTIHSETKWWTAEGPLDTALAAKTAQNVSMTIGSANTER